MSSIVQTSIPVAAEQTVLLATHHELAGMMDFLNSSVAPVPKARVIVSLASDADKENNSSLSCTEQTPFHGHPTTGAASIDTLCNPTKISVVNGDSVSQNTSLEAQIQAHSDVQGEAEGLGTSKVVSAAVNEHTTSSVDPDVREEQPQGSGDVDSSVSPPASPPTPTQRTRARSAQPPHRLKAPEIVSPLPAVVEGVASNGPLNPGQGATRTIIDKRMSLAPSAASRIGAFKIQPLRQGNSGSSGKTWTIRILAEDGRAGGFAYMKRVTKESLNKAGMFAEFRAYERMEMLAATRRSGSWSSLRPFVMQLEALCDAPDSMHIDFIFVSNMPLVTLCDLTNNIFPGRKCVNVPFLIYR